MWAMIPRLRMRSKGTVRGISLYPKNQVVFLSGNVKEPNALGDGT